MAATHQLHLSGGAANTDKNAALGGARSTAAGGVIPTALTANSLFADITGAQEAAGAIHYRCVYVINTGDVEALLTTIWISANTADTGTQIAITLGSSAVNGTEQTIANETTAPTGVSAFSEPASDGAGLAIGTLAAGAHKAVWVRRTIDAGTGSSNDTATLSVSFDTAS